MLWAAVLKNIHELHLHQSNRGIYPIADTMQNMEANFQKLLDRSRAAMLDYLDTYDRFSLIKTIEETVMEILIPAQFKDKDLENAKNRDESFVFHVLELYSLGFAFETLCCHM